MRKASIFTVLTVCIFLLAAARPLPALDSIQVEGGLIIIGNTEEKSAPSPLLPTFGAAFPLPLFKGSPLALKFGTLFFGTYYQYENDRATPVELEHRDFLVPAALPDLRAEISFPLGQRFRLGASAGLALLLRVPIPLFPDARENTGKTLGYFFAFRFLYPETGIFGQMQLRENLDLRLSARAYYPVFHLWDGEGLPFWDQFMIGTLIGVVYHFK